MRNKYWYEREALHYKQNLVKLGTYNKRLERLYMRSYNAVEKEIADFYARYARDNGLTLAMAKQKIDKFDVEAYQDRVQQLLKKKKLSAKARQELALYNATMRLNRLELLKANIGLSLVENFQDAEDTFKEALDEDATSEYRRQSGILGSTTQDMPKATLSAVVGGSFHNATFSDRIWAHQDELRYTLEGMLTQGLIQGRNPRDYIPPLRKAFDTSKYNAERLLRTEWARVQTDSATAVMRDNDVDQYVFIANGTACKTCSTLNGQHFRVSEQHVGDNAPPVHPNCMCAIAPWMERSTITGQTNYAKAIDSFDISEQAKTNYNVEDILEDMSRSPVGKDVIRHIRDTDVRIKIENQDPNGEGIRGVQQGNQIIIYSGNTDSTLIAAQTVIHEMTHYYYNIGCCQHAEAICFAMEKMHKERKNTLTTEEWDYVVKLAKDNYPEYNWEEGGYGSYDQFDFVEKIAKR